MTVTDVVIGKQIYEGKAKKIFETSDPQVLATRFKDDATAFNAQKRGTIDGKGVINNAISKTLFELLTQNHIPNHFIALPDPDTMLVKKVSIVPIEVVVRNIAAGSMAKSMGIEEGLVLNQPVIDLYYKDDALGDPYISESRITALGYCSQQDLETIKTLTLKINSILKPFFESIGILLVDFKLEFGKTSAGQIILADEISPDTCRFWDAQTKEKLDKDRFRRDLGNVAEAYQEMFKRITSKK